MKKITKNIDTLLSDYLKKISKDSSILAIKRHINKHAKEIFGEASPKEWIASMRNLVDIYEHQNKLKSNSDLRLHRLYHKWLKNKKYYTSPPKGVHKDLF